MSEIIRLDAMRPRQQALPEAPHIFKRLAITGSVSDPLRLELRDRDAAIHRRERWISWTIAAAAVVGLCCWRSLGWLVWG